MSTRRRIARTIGATALAAGLGLTGLVQSASAQEPAPQILVLRSDTLLRIAPASPGTVISSVAVTGLNEADRLLGIDLRPADGTVYGIGSSGIIYRIDATTGAATQGPTAATIPSGSDFGVDFNPAADRLRVVSDTGQSLRINVDDGATTVDGSLAYDPADAGAGSTPSVVAAAYTNPDTDPATGTELFDIDAARDVLVLQDPPNDGVLATRGPLGADAGDATAFDISSSGRAMAIIGGVLVDVDLADGSTTAIGAVTGGAADGMAFVPASTGTTTTTTPTGPGTTAPPTELPRTGSEDLALGLAGGALVAAGAALVAAAARRRPVASS